MKTVIVCTNRRSNPAQPSCGARGGDRLADQLEQVIAARGLAIRLERFPCLGRCEEGPNLKLAPDGPICSHLDEAKLPDLLRQIETFIETGGVPKSGSAATDP